MRGNPYPHRYKEKFEDVISENDFVGFLERARRLESERAARPVLLESLNIRGLIAILYWTGLRVSEVVGDRPHAYKTRKKGIVKSAEIKGLRKEDLDVVGDYLLIKIKEARKWGRREEPIWLPLNKPGVMDIVEAWKATPPGERIFPISKVYAWKLVKQVTDRLYPHFFRLNRATHFAMDPRTSLFDLKAWFAWSDPRTIAKYMGKAGRTTREMAKRL